MNKYLLGLFFLVSISMKAQYPYGHEWIDFSKPHYKFAISNPSVYRIPYAYLSTNFPDIASASASEICLFNNGKQVPIFLSWTTSPTASDFIEFVGEKLESKVDKYLYQDSTHILNPYVSLFKDTNYYFLTIRSGTNARIIEYSNDTLSVSDSYLPYCIGNSLITFKQVYSDGRRWYYDGTGYVVSPSYDIGEGWGTNSYTSQSIPTPNALSISSENLKLNLRLFGRNETTHRLDIKLNGSLASTVQEVGSTNIHLSTSMPSGTITGASSTLTITPLLTNNHGYCLGFAQLLYPRNLNFSGLNFFQFSLPVSSNASRFSISGYNSTNLVILHDIINRTRTTHDPSANHRFLVNLQNSNSSLALTHEGIISTVNNLKEINFQNILDQQGDFLLITHRAVQFDSSGQDVIQAYKQYKESQVGGSFRVAVAYVEDLQEIFGYGIPKHPLAVRKYLQYAKNFWTTTPPKYAFIVGKGYIANNIFSSSGANYTNNLIPSFGHAPSDFHFTTMDGSNEQFIPIGRLSAPNGNIVRNYLEKLKEYNAEYLATSDIDQNPNKKEYMKWYIHLGGGTGVSQQTDFRNNLKSYESKIIDTLHGAKVFSVFKNGPDISQDISSVDLTNRINKGVSLISFFGHSSATLFDVGIGEPSTFTNQGKYPIFLANGCNSGYFYSGSNSYSESFINLPNKGAIGFLATTNNALDITLYQYGNIFYDHLSKLSYGSSIGHIMQKTAANLLSGGMNYLKTTPMEFNLNGDPSVMINQYPVPDYYIDAQSLLLPTNNLNTTQDSFQIKLIIQNLGKAVKSQIKLKVERINNGNTAVYEKLVNAPYFKDTFAISMPIVDQKFGIGVNSFNIKIDGDDQWTEVSEANNEIKNIGNLLIENDDIIPIFPYEFSIVTSSTSKLTAMSTLVNRSPQNYVFQLDTTELFNSPSLKTYTALNTAENIISWLPQTVFQDSIVYYWRVSRDSNATRGYRWNQSSFIYIPNQPMGGWNQSHYYQFLKNDNKNIVLNTSRNFQFVNDIKSIYVKTNGTNNTYDVEWYLNNARQAALREAGRMTNGMFIIWIDGKSGIARQSIDSNYGSGTWGKYGSIQFGYAGLGREGFVFQDTGVTPANHPRPNTPWSTIILDFVNQVPNGDYLIFYSYKKPVYDKWSSDLKSYFINAGFSSLQQLVDKTVIAPFIFGYKKNDGSFTPYSKIGTDYTSFTTGELFINGAWKEGYKQSVKIGPTLRWHTLSYSLSHYEDPNEDITQVELYGLKSNLQKDKLATFTSLKLDTTLLWIDPNVYTNLQLKLNSKDDKNRTPTKLNFWRILYDDIGEVAINNVPNLLPVMRDTIENGDIYTLHLGTETLNAKNFDSISYHINIIQGGQSKLIQGKFPPIEGNNFMAQQRVLSMDNYFEGENQITYQINPTNFGYQKEKYDVNNYGKAKFYVKSDIENPLLDVTFDGVHIINNELVASSPNIRIILKDENQYLLLDDTSLISLYLKYPDGSLLPIYFNQSNVSYTLASSSNNNRAEINYKPLLTDGSYQLIVKDRDKSGNSSSRNGSFDYKISFQVMTKNQISQFLNYPNPFSTSTQFVFTLTGAKVPDFIKIQIVNIRGQVVKEIFKENLGPIKLGLNRTQYAWDGRDQYGDLLANGVYLYKVVVKDNGKDYPMMNAEDMSIITKSKANISQYFNDGWGKMVILR